MCTHILDLLIPVLISESHRDVVYGNVSVLDIDFLNFSVIWSFCSNEYEYSSFMEVDAL